MIGLYAAVCAALLAISGFAFDLDNVRALPIPYPIFHLGLGVVCVFIFVLERRGRILKDLCTKRVGMALLAMYTIGLVSSLVTGAGDIYALGMKSATFFLNYAWFVFGVNHYGSRFSVLFTKWFLLISIALASFFPVFLGEQMNNNWAGITLAFSFVFYALSSLEKSKLFIVSGFLIIAFYAVLVLNARGVFIASVSAGAYILLMAVAPQRVVRAINRMAFVSMPLLAVLTGALGVLLYRSVYYVDLVKWSIETTGKSLDSSRLERWDMGFRLFLERPLFGWGVDAHIVRVVSETDFGDLHNLWWEYLFRFGSIGGALLLAVFFYISVMLYRGHRSPVDVASYLVIFIFLSVYSLGGVTHWPGSYMFWYVLGVLVARSGASSFGVRSPKSVYPHALARFQRAHRIVIF